MNRRVLYISGISIIIGLAASLIAQALTHLIGFITNVSFYGRFSTEFNSPADNHLGWWVILVPVVGGLIVGLMAKMATRPIRGHGIPEAMEQILTNESRIPARITLLNRFRQQSPLEPVVPSG